MEIKVFTAFSGYDSQCLALERLQRENEDFSYDLVGWSEIDPYAIRAHNALFPWCHKRNYGDISQIDWNTVPDFDLFTYSSPCQDFSNAGKQAGGERGSGTRSSLLWECERAIRAKRPKYLLMENVAALVSKKFIKTCHRWLDTLHEIGYSNFPCIMNAKDYGVPQNRKRIFVVSILDPNAVFTFPRKIKLTRKLKDLLEPTVPEKYYLKDERLYGIMQSSQKQADKGNGFAFNPTNGENVAHSVTSNAGNRKTDNFIQEPNRGGQIVLGWTRDAKGNIIDRHPVNVANAVTSAKRDNTQNYVVEHE